ncbi:MAG: hypothetical protein HY618_04490, partial [Candidatus Tectomicrobia bacterium]|nr:hypothetical protein [Candidatus Tectomicrobia bacterium]
MRLSDLIKQGPEGQDPKNKKKPEPAPEKPLEEKPKGEEEAFRLSKVADFRGPQPGARQTPSRRPSDEEEPLAPPPLPGVGPSPQGRAAKPRP